MTRDITLGQYFPGNSPVHRADPRLKLILVFLYIIQLFVAPSLLSIGLSAVELLLLFAVAQIPVKTVLRSLRPILPIILFTAVVNLFFARGDVIFKWQFIEITKQGLYLSGVMVLRIICLIAATSLLTYTTSPIELTDAMERVMAPLKVLHAPVHEIAMMMSIALRFIPTLVEETDKIMSAQKARGAELDTGNLMSRVRALIPVLIPLFISAFRRADELSIAMDSRCYHGGEGRTRLKVLQMHTGDWMFAALAVAIFAVAVAVDRFVKLPL